MFTGLVQSLAQVADVVSEPPGVRLVIRQAELAAIARIGDSVALNGCCLTLVALENDLLSFQAGEETLSRTNLGELRADDFVNMETSLRAGDPLGGHYVTGHVDAVGIVDARRDEGDWCTMWFRAPSPHLAQMASKGSIAVDGVSLTLVDVEAGRFSVALIPHTLEMTTLGGRKVGDRVNLETDVLAKYVERQLQSLNALVPTSQIPVASTTWERRSPTLCVASATAKPAGRPRSAFPPRAWDKVCAMPRQTKTFLLERFREMGIRPATRHGQNFLIDLNLVQLIVDAAELTKDDVVLEVGTGTGSLTAMMAERAAAVVTVEIDAHLFELASEQLIDLPNVTMLRLDALRNKNNIDDRIMDAVGDHLGAAPGRRFKLVANLPYNIATPVLSNLLLARYVPHSMTATIQKELADRITAQPSTKDYSALSVWIQSQATAEIIRLLPPSVFWPAPKVTSAILRIVVDPARRAQIADLQYVHQITKALFLHRRKFLRANVLAAMKRHLAKEQVDDLLNEMGFSADTRTEQLDVPTLIHLAEKIRAAAPDWKL